LGLPVARRRMYRFFDRQGATPHRSLRDMLWCQSRRTVNLRPEAFLSAGPAQTDFQEETLFDTEDSGPTSVLRRQSFARARKTPLLSSANSSSSAPPFGHMWCVRPFHRMLLWCQPIGAASCASPPKEDVNAPHCA